MSRGTGITLSLVLGLFVAGCFTPSFTRPRQFSIDPEIGLPQFEPTDQTVGIRALEFARLYRQPMVYRGPDHEIGYREDAEWAEPPRDLLTRALADALIATGRFRDVGNAADVRNPDFLLMGEVRRFDEDRTTTPWTAVCEVRLELRRGNSRDAVWSGTLAAQEPISGKNPSSLAAAMSQAVARVVEQAATRIGELGPKTNLDASAQDVF